MKLDIMNFGTEETLARYTCDGQESMLLMDACAALREARFPGIMSKLPRMFDEDDVARILGNQEEASTLLGILELEQSFHQALHLFPGGHDHADDEGDEG